MFDRFAVWPDRMIYLRYDMLGLEVRSFVPFST